MYGPDITYLPHLLLLFLLLLVAITIRVRLRLHRIRVYFFCIWFFFLSAAYIAGRLSWKGLIEGPSSWVALGFYCFIAVLYEKLLRCCLSPTWSSQLLGVCSLLCYIIRNWRSSLAIHSLLSLLIYPPWHQAAGHWSDSFLWWPVTEAQPLCDAGQWDASMRCKNSCLLFILVCRNFFSLVRSLFLTGFIHSLFCVFCRQISQEYNKITFA